METHGEACRGKRTPLHSIWGAMIQRSTNINHPKYKDYGGRGILVCDEWRNYITFRNWALNNGYIKGLEIDRKDNNKGYFPNNCHFVIHRINLLNRRKSINWGIVKQKKLFMVQVTRYNIRYCIGRFRTIDIAIKQRDYFVENYEILKNIYPSYPQNKIKKLLL